VPAFSPRLSPFFDRGLAAVAAVFFAVVEAAAGFLLRRLRPVFLPELLRFLFWPGGLLFLRSGFLFNRFGIKGTSLTLRSWRFRQTRKGLRIVYSQFESIFAIQFDSGFFQTVHKVGVIHSAARQAR
jgi:hypothetical protein